MTLDAESLNIPATTYSSQVVLPSGDFARTCKELSKLSENGKFRTLKKQEKCWKIDSRNFENSTFKAKIWHKYTIYGVRVLMLHLK